MITRERIGTIFKLAYPITIALSSSLIMALIDIAMVGTLGDNAIAAVGLASFSYTLVTALVAGIAPAVQGLVARRRGEGSSEPGCLPLNAGLLLAVLVGIPLTLVCYALTPGFFSLISSDSEVTRIGVPYLRTLYLAVAMVGLNNAFEGYWTAVERPKVYMVVVIVMNCLNILINYVLIFGHFGAPALGVRGAAIGTASAICVGVIINFVMAGLHLRRDGFLRAKPESPLLARVLQMGIPATMQEFFYSAGYIVFFWMIGQVGTTDLAAANVLVRVTMMLVLLAMALGMTSATLVSKTVGEGDLAGAAQWGWDTAKVGVIGITLLGLPLLLFPQFFLSLFLNDPHTIQVATIPMRLVAATTGAGSLIYIFSYTLYSVGDGNRVIMISFSTQWLFFLPAVWIVGPHLNYGLLQIWLVQIAYGAIATALITTIWINGRWKTVKV